MTNLNMETWEEEEENKVRRFKNINRTTEELVVI
jgi:hypothetical protein